MLISLSAVEYKWYKYTAKRVTEVDTANKKWYMEIGNGDIIGIRELNDGGAYVVDQEDQKTKYRLDDKKALDSLLRKCVPHHGKVKPANAPIRDVKVEKDKNNPDAYTWHKYNGLRRISLVNFSGTNMGKIEKGEVFGLFTLNPEKGGWFMADVTMQNIKTAKPIKLSADMLSQLIAKSAPLKNRPVAEIPTSDEVTPKVTTIKPVVKPPREIKPSNGVPSVTDLKELNSRVAEINRKWKELAKSRIKSFDDYKAVKAAMEAVRNTDCYVDLKEYMHSINVSAEMAKVLLDTLAANWKTSVLVISEKKRNLSNAPATEEVEEEESAPLGDQKPIEIGGSKKDLRPAEVLKNLIAGLKSKALESAMAADVNEVDSLIEDLNNLKSKAIGRIDKALPGADNKERAESYYDKLQRAYDSALKKLQERRAMLEEKEEETPEVQDTWDDSATDDFTPVDEEVPTPVEDDEDRTATEEEMDELDDMFSDKPEKKSKPVQIDETEEDDVDSLFDDDGFDGNLGIQMEDDE